MTDRKHRRANIEVLPTRAAAERRRRAKAQAKSKKRSTRLTRLLENLGWLLVAAAIGVPLLAAALYLTN